MSHDPPRENQREIPTPADPPTVVEKKVESTTAKKKETKKTAVRKKEAAADGDGEPVPLPAAVVAHAREATTTAMRQPPRRGYQIGRFRFTYYWVAEERSRKSARTPLYNSRCRRIATVNKRFAKRLIMEGTGRLLDGRMLNIGGACKCPTSPCVVVLDQKHPWGAGSASRALAPFRSVAVDPRKIRIGRWLYIPELDGLTVPGVPPNGGFVHDGCVVADDQGHGVRGRKLDFFAARKANYTAFHRRNRLNVVTVHDGTERCSRQARARRARTKSTHRNAI
jgi:3D (Asp-Asp-Asp) domain-containing protein